MCSTRSMIAVVTFGDGNTTVKNLKKCWETLPGPRESEREREMSGRERERREGESERGWGVKKSPLGGGTRDANARATTTAAEREMVRPERRLYFYKIGPTTTRSRRRRRKRVNPYRPHPPPRRLRRADESRRRRARRTPSHAPRGERSHAITPDRVVLPNATAADRVVRTAHHHPFTVTRAPCTPVFFPRARHAQNGAYFFIPFPTLLSLFIIVIIITIYYYYYY